MVNESSMQGMQIQTKSMNPQNAPRSDSNGQNAEVVQGVKEIHPMKNNLWWLWLIIGLILGMGLSAGYFLFLK